MSIVRSLVRSVYSALPFKRTAFMALRAIHVPSERVFRHLHFHGAFRVRIDAAHSFLMMHHGYQIENEIFWRGLEGGWERTSFALWMRLATRARTIIDVGANTGIYALMARCLNPDAIVYALEPVDRVYRRLVENVRLNRYDIRCFPQAASHRDGSAVIYDPGTEHVLSVTLDCNRAGPDVPVTPVEVRTIRLATLLDQEQAPALDLVKIDVESHEPEVLDGLGSYLARDRPTMLIEVLDDTAGQRIEERVEKFGYWFFDINEGGSVRRVKHIGKSSTFNYLLCSEETAEWLGLAQAASGQVSHG
jgi:FkbM family methyltransferase